MKRPVVLAVLLALPAFAQEVTPVDAPSPSYDAAAKQDPTPGMPEEIAASLAPRPGDVSPQSVTEGTNGDIFLNSPSPWTSAGVLLQAKAMWPNIAAKLGNSTTTGEFSVADSADRKLLVVRGDGHVGIGTSSPGALLDMRRDVNGATRLRIDNGDPGNATTASTAGIMLSEGGVNKVSIASIGSLTGVDKAAGGPNALQLWNYANGPTVFGTDGSERMRIAAAGNVGIGIVPSDSYQLQIQRRTSGGAAVQAFHSTVISADSSQHDVGAFLYGYQNVVAGVTNTGDVTGGRARGWLYGAGTVSQTYGVLAETGLYPSTAVSGTIQNAYGVRVDIASRYGTITKGYGLFVEDVEAGTGYGIYQEGANDSNFLAGNVGIGTLPTSRALEVKGDAHFDGTVTGTNIKAKYQDVAEWVPASHDLTPGTVVVLNPERDNEVMPSSSSYDTTVAGVVSAQPGISLGEEAEGSEQIATTGRVKVRVDATRGPIRIGDLLVTSDVPGTAMRSEPLELQGRRIHQPGTIIGKALQPLASGVGEILVLLSMQ